MSKYFELHSNKLCHGMTKSKSSASAIGLLSSFMVHLVSGSQFINATLVAALRPKIIILYLPRIKVSLKS